MFEVPDNNYIYEMYEREQLRYNVANMRLERDEEIEASELPFYDDEEIEEC